MTQTRSIEKCITALMFMSLCSVVAPRAFAADTAEDLFKARLLQGERFVAEQAFDQARETYRDAIAAADVTQEKRWLALRAAVTLLLEHRRQDDAVALLLHFWENAKGLDAGNALRTAGHIRRGQGRHAEALAIFRNVDAGAFTGSLVDADLRGRAEEMRAVLEDPPGFWIAPYVPFATPRGAEMLWVSRHPARGGTVEIFEDVKRVASVPATATDVAAEPGFFYQRAAIEGLQPGRRYTYRVTVGEETREGTFKTPLDSGSRKPVHFTVYGDSQDRPQFHRQTAAAMARENPDFVLHLGDLVGRGNYWGHWKMQFFEPARAYLADTIILPTVGNHDGSGFFDQLFVPQRGVNRSFRWGNVEVFVVASYRSGGKGSAARAKQLAWVTEALQASDAEWKIVNTHYPMISNNPEGWSNWGQDDFLPVFEEHGVDIVFTGHEHVYRRLLPISKGGRHSVLHIVSGGAASTGGDYGYAGVAPPLDPNPMVAAGSRSLHYGAVRIVGNRLHYQAKHRDGTVFDEFVLDKGSADYARTHREEAVPFDIALESIRYLNDMTDSTGTFAVRMRDVPKKGEPLDVILEHPETDRDVKVRAAAVPGGPWEVVKEEVPLVDGTLVFRVRPAADVVLNPGRIAPALAISVRHVVDDVPLAPQTFAFRLSETSYMELAEQLGNGPRLPLNWNFKFDPEGEGVAARWFAADHSGEWGVAPVTRPWNDVFDLEYNGNAWYQTTFTAPVVPAGQELYLRLENADESCWVYLNGQFVAGQIYDSAIDDEAWRKPRRFLLSPALKEGTNILAVRVRAAVGQGGLYRGARLTFHPRNRIPDGTFGEGLRRWSLPDSADKTGTHRVSAVPGKFVDEWAVHVHADGEADARLTSEAFGLEAGAYRLDMRYEQKTAPAAAVDGIRLELVDARDATSAWKGAAPPRFDAQWEKQSFDVRIPEGQSFSGHLRIDVSRGGECKLDEVRLYPISDRSAIAETAPDASASASWTNPRFDRSPAAPEIALARDGRAVLPIVVWNPENQEVRRLAETLKSLLDKMTGGHFEILDGPREGGIQVGLAGTAPVEGTDGFFRLDDPRGREDYVLQTFPKGVRLVGASPLGLRHAVWDFLHRCGYRRFFPTETWEVVPHEPDLKVQIDLGESPDFLSRTWGYGGGTWRYNRDDARRWLERNRMAGSIGLRTSHAYQAITSELRDVFEANPDLYALSHGERKYRGDVTKFCFANPALTNIVVDWALETFRKNPASDSISLDPSDGMAWCECDACARLGSITDQVVGLANTVAARVQEEFPGKLIGMLGYGAYSPPPTIRVHPNLVITITDGFIRGGYTFAGLLEGWHKQGATLGTYDYWSVFQWDRDLPGASRAARPYRWRESLPFIHSKGVRFFRAESSDNWGPNGLGYYIMSRILWDVREAERIDELREDFLRKAFGPAADPMRAFYGLICTDVRPLISEDLVGRMYRRLGEAVKRTGEDSGERARIEDLMLYTRYVEIAMQYQNAKGGERQQRWEAMMKFVYRIKETSMVQTLQFFYQYRGRMDRSITFPPNGDIRIGEGENPLRDPTPVTRGENYEWLRDGIANNALLTFTARAFSDDLVPAAGPLGLTTPWRGTWGPWVAQGAHTFYTWVDKTGEPIGLEVTGGRIAHYRDRGNVQLTLHAAADQLLHGVSEDNSVPPDGEPRTVRLATPYEGLHWIDVGTGGDAAGVEPLDEGRPWTVKSGLDQPTKFNYRSKLFFYVPKGTEVVGGYAQKSGGKMHDGAGQAVYDFAEAAASGYFAVPVAPGQDGSLWSLQGVAGQRLLMTVPPYVARSAEELLLPREVVEADAKQR